MKKTSVPINWGSVLDDLNGSRRGLKNMLMMENYRFSIGRYWYLLMNNNPLSSDLGLHFQASYATQTFWLQTTSSQFYQLRLALLASTMTFNYLATKLDGFDISQKRDQ